MKIPLLVTTFVLTACGGVSGVDQAPDAVLLDYRSPLANKDGGKAPTAHEKTLEVGVRERGKDHRAPVRVQWTTAQDDAGCLRVQTIKIARTGGPRSTEVYKARAKPVPGDCIRAGFDPVEQFSIAFCWRWNGASNKDDCAYENRLNLRADSVGLEDLPPPAP